MINAQVSNLIKIGWYPTGQAAQQENLVAQK